MISAPPNRDPWAAFAGVPFLCGLLAAGAQVLFLRESLLLGAGNEFTVGLCLAVWVLLGAAGSLVGALLGHRLRDTAAESCVVALGMLAVLLPCTVLFLGQVRQWFGVLPGEMVSAGRLAALLVLALLPLVPLLGFTFACAYTYYRVRLAADGEDIGRTYAWDALGAFAAGTATALAFLAGWDSVQTSLGLGAVTVTWLIGFSVLNRRRYARDAWLYAVALLLFAGVLAAAWARQDTVRRGLLRRAWPGYDVVSTRQSVYGSTTVLARGRQRALFHNGSLTAVSDAPEAAAEFVHLALLQSAQPRRVLVFGGAAGGLLPAVLQHPVEQVEAVELDPVLLDGALETFHPALVGDPRLTFQHLDGRRFLARPLAPYDVVLLHVGDPGTIQAGRLCTVESFRQMRAQLAPDGVLALAVSGDDAFLSPALAGYLRSLRATLGEVFPHVAALPGSVTIFFASRAVPPVPDPAAWAERAAARGLSSPAVGRNRLAQRLDPERVQWLAAQLAVAGAPIHSDLRPVLPWYVVRFWRQQFSLRGLAADWGRQRLRVAVGAVVGLAVLQALCVLVRPRRPLLVAFLALNGLNGMGLSTFLLLSAQALFGFLFFLCGLLIAAFMCGLSAGACLHVWWGRRPWVRLAPIPLCQGGILAVYALAAVLPLGGMAAGGSDVATVGLALLYVLLSALAGGFVGFQFLEGCAAARRLGCGTGLTSDLGLYVIDLLGGCAGALVVAPTLIPLLGFAECAALLGLLNIGIGAAAWLRLR